MAALALVGAMMSSCSEEIEVVQPANTGKTVMVKTTVSLGENATTRALTEAGEKTFAAGDQIAVIYKNTDDQTVKAVSVALTTADINATDAHNATFSVPLTNPQPSGDVRYIYPASMAADDVSATTPDNDATIKWTNLTTQDGTLASLASNLDLATFDGTMTAEGKLPNSADLENQLTIGKFTIKNSDGSDITNIITGLNISDGSNTYAVTREAAADPIYVAMQEVSSSQTINVKATVGTNQYTKSVTGNTLARNTIYPINVSMLVPTISFAESMKSWGAEDGNFTLEVTNNADGVVTYTSSDPNVASVDPATGKVTPGTVTSTTNVTITATVADSENAIYPTKTAQYTLTLDKGYRYLEWDDTSKGLVYRMASPVSDNDLIDDNSGAAEKLQTGGGVKFVKGNITIGGDVTIPTDLQLILLDGAKLEINGQLSTSTSASLYISAQSEGTQRGQLEVNASTTAGIECKNLMVYGGYIKTTGGKLPAYPSTAFSGANINGNFEICGGEFETIGNNTGNYADGIFVNGNMIVKGHAVVSAIGYSYWGNMFDNTKGDGIEINGILTIQDDARVSAIGGTPSTQYYGGNGVNGAIAYYGGTFTAIAGDGYYETCKAVTSTITNMTENTVVFESSSNCTDWDGSFELAPNTPTTYGHLGIRKQ